MMTTEKWLAVVMVITAAAGTVWYLILELRDNEISAVGWSLLAVIWFVVIRRLVYIWMRGRGE